MTWISHFSLHFSLHFTSRISYKFVFFYDLGIPTQKKYNLENCTFANALFLQFVFCSRSSPDLGNNVWFGSRLPPARGLLSNLQSLVVLLHVSALPTFFASVRFDRSAYFGIFALLIVYGGGVRATIHFTAGARPIRRLQLLWLTRKIHLFHAGKRTASPSETDWVCLQALLHSLDILRLLAMACRRLAVSMICLIALWSLRWRSWTSPSTMRWGSCQRCSWTWARAIHAMHTLAVMGARSVWPQPPRTIRLARIALCCPWSCCIGRATHQHWKSLST